MRKVYLCTERREPGEIIRSAAHRDFTEARVVGFVSYRESNPLSAALEKGQADERHVLKTGGVALLLFFASLCKAAWFYRMF